MEQHVFFLRNWEVSQGRINNSDVDDDGEDDDDDGDGDGDFDDDQYVGCQRPKDYDYYDDSTINL